MTPRNRECYGRWDIPMDAAQIARRGGAAVWARQRRPLSAVEDQSGNVAWPSVMVAVCDTAEASIQVRLTVSPTLKLSIALWRWLVLATVLPPMLVIRPQTVTPAPAA